MKRWLTVVAIVSACPALAAEATLLVPPDLRYVEPPAMTFTDLDLTDEFQPPDGRSYLQGNSSGDTFGGPKGPHVSSKVAADGTRIIKTLGGGSEYASSTFVYSQPDFISLPPALLLPPRMAVTLSMTAALTVRVHPDLGCAPSDPSSCDAAQAFAGITLTIFDLDRVDRTNLADGLSLGVEAGSGPTFAEASRALSVSYSNTSDESLGISWIAAHGFLVSTPDGITAVIPEPKAYALMLAGLGLLGAQAVRRKQA